MRSPLFFRVGANAAAQGPNEITPLPGVEAESGHIGWACKTLTKVNFSIKLFFTSSETATGTKVEF